MLPYVVIITFVFYSLFSPLIDWIVWETNWYVWAPIDALLYIVWWVSGMRRRFWNRFWWYWLFEDPSLKSWCWDVCYDVTTPLIQYYERASGHLVKQVQPEKREDDRPTEEDIYFEAQSKLKFDNICGYSNFGYCADPSMLKTETSGQFYKKELYRYICTEFLGPVKEDLLLVEFGCGRGAGTVYMSELLKTKQSNGTDFNESLI